MMRLKRSWKLGLLVFAIFWVVDFGRNPLQAAPTATLLAHWQFEEGGVSPTTADSAGGHTGTLSGATWSPTVVGQPLSDSTQSLYFNGSNAYVDSEAFGINNDFTVSAWINPNSLTNRAILAKNGSGDNNSNQLLIGFYQSGYNVTIQGEDFIGGTPVYGWQHILVTGESNGSGGTLVTFYRNGVQLWDAYLNAEIGDVDNGRPWTIGSEWDGNVRGDYFNGHIDDVRIYDDALTDAEIAALTPDFEELELLVEFPMDEGGGATTNSTGSIVGTLVNAQWTNNSIDGTASVAFDGSNDYIVANSDHSLRVDGEATFAAWIYPTGSGSATTYGGIIVNKEGEYEIARFQDGSIGFAFANSSPGWTWRDTNIVAPLNTWSHVAVTYSSAMGQVKTYLNGAHRHTLSVTGAIGDIDTGKNQFQIGSRQAQGQDFDGQIDHVVVYRAALDAAKIAELAAISGGVCNVPSATYVTIQEAALDRDCDTINASAGTFGELEFETNHPITIVGAGMADTVVDLGGNKRWMKAYHPVTLRNLTVQNGSADFGGVVWNHALLSLENVTLTNNTASVHGGAIYADGPVEAVNTIISNNTAGHGGAISSYDKLTLNNTQVVSNTANRQHGPRGGGIFASGETIIENNSLIAGNSLAGAGTSYSAGGGIYLAGSLYMTDSTVRDNSAPNRSGGGIFYHSCWGCGRASAGGDVSYRKPIDIRYSTFTGNTARHGGAIANYVGKVELLQVTMEGNHAQFGGAVALLQDWQGAGSLNVNHGLFKDNTATVDLSVSDSGRGGAIYAEGTAYLWFVQFDGNSAEKGGHIYGTEARYSGDANSYISVIRASLVGGAATQGGAIYTEAGANVYQTTLSGNSAEQGAAVYKTSSGSVSVHTSTVNDSVNTEASGSALFANGGSMTLSRSIVDSIGGTNCGGSQLFSGGNNLIGDASCDVGNTTDLQADPLLGPLVTDGPRTDYHMPLDYSPAINAYEETNCAEVADQLFKLHNIDVTDRPIGPRCDIGAVEVPADVLATYAKPWERYFEWASSNFYQPTHSFRTQDLTRPDQNDITTLDDLSQNYATFAEGRHFYRYCADENATVAVAGQPCTNWGEGSFSDAIDVDTHPTSGSDVPTDLHNQLLIALDDFSAIEAAPQRTMTVTYKGEQVTAPIQTLAISATVDAVLEMAYIPQIYGNEFMVDALRYSFGPAEQLGATSGAQIIQDEIDQLELARQQFANVTALFEWAYGEGHTDGFDSAEFETIANASEREIEATLEIIKRQRLLGDSPISLITAINEAYISQYLQANLLANAIQRAGLASRAEDAQAIFLENGGWRVMNNLEALQQLADSIRNDTNLIGYDKNYVPRSPLDSLEDRLGTLGSCNLTTGVVTGGSGELLALLQKECAAGAADRGFDQNASDLADELDALETNFRDELIRLCGGDSTSPDWNPQACVEGEMGVNYNELEAAQEAAGLAWQRAQNIPELIRIEQQRAGTVIRMTLQTGQQLQALEHSIGMLSAYREVTTSSTTTEIWAPGSDPNDPTSGAYWLDFGKDATNCLLSGFTLGALGDGCQGNNDNLFGSIGALAGIEDKPTAIETVDTISDPNEYEIGVHKGTKAIREATRDATIENANSNAEIKRMLLEQADLLIEYEIAVDELNRVISERNLLIQQHRRALNEYSRIEGNIADDFVNRPDYRIIRDITATNAESARDRAVQLTYLTIKALEYELLAEPMATGNCSGDISAESSLYDALYLARTTAHLDAIRCEVDLITLPLEVMTGNRYPVQISIAKDIWGLTNDNLEELLPYTPDANSTTWQTDAPGCGPLPLTINDVDTLRFCLFQERLHAAIIDNATVRELASNNNLPASGQSIYFDFNSQLEQDVELNDYGRWNIRIADNAMCGGDACGVALNIKTKQSYNGNPVSIFLTHQGQATYRTASGGVTAYNPGLTALIGQTIPDGWPSGSAVNAAIIAGVNGSGGFLNRDLTNLSAATTDWRLRLDLSGSGSGLDRYQLEDFVISMDTIALSVNSRRAEEISAEITQLESQGQPVPAALLAERDYINEQLARAERAKAAPRAVTEDVTPPSVLSKDVIGGTYNGNVIVQEPVPMGIFDLGVTITRTVQGLTGDLCGECTPLYDSAPITGIFTSTGTMTDTFSLQSVPFTQFIDGKMVTRTISMVGIVYRDGDVMEGTYTELIEGYGDETMVVEGTYIANRPMQFYDFTEIEGTPTAINLSDVAADATTTVWLPILLAGTLCGTLWLSRRRDSI